jgi:hypothetical protein
VPGHNLNYSGCLLITAQQAVPSSSLSCPTGSKTEFIRTQGPGVFSFSMPCGSLLMLSTSTVLRPHFVVFSRAAQRVALLIAQLVAVMNPGYQRCCCHGDEFCAAAETFRPNRATTAEVIFRDDQLRFFFDGWHNHCQTAH